MTKTTIVKRYVDGFAQRAEATGGLEQGLEELKNVKHLIRQHPELMAFFKNPIIPPQEKHRLIALIFKDGFSGLLKHFLSYLIDKRRIGLLLEIIEDAHERYAHREELDVLLKVSFPLDLETMKEIKERLEKKVGRRLKLYVHLDADLHGGISATVGNIVFDNSLEGSLKELRERLMELKIR